MLLRACKERAQTCRLVREKSTLEAVAAREPQLGEPSIPTPIGTMMLAGDCSWQASRSAVERSLSQNKQQLGNGTTTYHSYHSAVSDALGSRDTSVCSKTPRGH